MDIERIVFIQKLKEWSCYGELSRYKYETKCYDSITLVLTLHPALNLLHEILQRARKHVLKSPRLHSAVPSPPRVAFRNPERIRNKLVGSKLKEFIYKMLASISVVILTIIYVKYLKVEISLKVRLPKKYHINFPCDCNSCRVVYLLTCQVCLKLYVRSTVARFRRNVLTFRINSI